MFKCLMIIIFTKNNYKMLSNYITYYKMPTVSILDESKIKNIFDNQQYLDLIVNTEEKRLKTQEVVIDSALNNQKRLMLLNDSFRKRYNEYIRIFIIISVSIVLIFGLVLLESNFPVIPSIVISILTSIILVIAIILILLVINNLYNRDRTDYDKLDTNDWAFDNNSGSGSGFRMGSGSKTETTVAKTCSNENCCDVGTYWCPNSSRCLLGSEWNTLCSNSSTYNEFNVN